mmetsp:Transcript_2773/g.4878  ORF Transcript_2773/g.4878 Transcript_2773/m.4878 type:complete len:117 (+) Transcript_2773:791-1141(+)
MEIAFLGGNHGVFRGGLKVGFVNAKSSCSAKKPSHTFMVGSGGKKKKLTKEESNERYKEKKVTKAAEVQKSQNFSDAWAEQNRGKVDIWLVIGLLTLLTPAGVLIYGISSGMIPIN